METLFLKQERLLAQISTRIVRELMNQIHWDNRLIADSHPGLSWSRQDNTDVAIHQVALPGRKS